MKKILFSLIALISVMTVQAQSICASWRTMQPIVETEEDGSFTAQSLLYTFNQDGTYSYTNELTMSTEPAPTMALEIALSIELKGTYTLEGEQMTLTPNMDTFNADLLSVSVNGHVSEDPAMKANIKSMLLGNEFKAQFTEVKQYTNVKVGDQMLQMSNDGQELMFVRFATIQN